MADAPINLNKARKARAKVEKQSKAAENRTTFGRSKAEKAASQQSADRAARDLDGKKRD